jgi:LysR family hydrogen peroxide-inducible transcriptional activator
MTLRELRYLVALADKQNFVRAAESCHVGQPTLSMQVRKLEDYLEVKLFERDNHHVSATPIGEEVIERARIALEAVDEIRELTRQARDPMDGLVRLGAIPTLGPYLVPPLLPTLKRVYPQLRIVLHEDRAANLLEGLRGYRFDALLLTLPVKNGDVAAMPLFREALTLALPAGHPLDARAQIERDDLDPDGMLVLEEGHCLRDLALSLWPLSPAAHGGASEASSLETLRQMVAAGLGWTLLPALAALPGVASFEQGPVRLRPLSPPVPTRTVGIVWRNGYSRLATIRTLARFIQANLPAGIEVLTPDCDKGVDHV